MPYLDWAKSGLIDLTPGDVVDYDFVFAKILSLCELYQIQNISYDPWNATQFAIKLEESGATTKAFTQTTRYFNEPVTWIERSIMQGTYDHGGNAVLRWMAGNIALYKDSNGLVRFDKKKSQEKIDGMVSLAMSVGDYLDKKTEESIYNKRDGILMF